MTKYKDFDDFWKQHGRFMDRERRFEDMARIVFEASRERVVPEGTEEVAPGLYSVPSRSLFKKKE